MKLQDILRAVQEYHPSPDLEIIRRAYSFVQHHHKGQTRASGEPYVTHVSEVAFLAAKLRLDVASIVTALLHDTVEDTNVAISDIHNEFGDDISKLVDGVTKLSRVKFSSREEQQAENFRKMLLAMANDIRVLLVKLCDRTHNMRTLEYLSESRRTRIAQETLDIYAPLAHRLGIYWMKSELEDLSFRYLKPEVYEGIKSNVNKKKKERERYIDDVVKLLKTEFDAHKLDAQIYGRPKHFYSIYQKMETQGLYFDEIYDLIAFRIIVSTTMECYSALGLVHAAWKPIPGRFKDYIAMPKPNNYQSLHTTVIGPHGMRIEIQIRTNEMHEIAERGIAAHWVYKEQGEPTSERAVAKQQFTWLKDLIESERLHRDPYEFLSIVKEDLFPEEVFVFSPKGDVVALQAGSTPVDFAYHIHSEIGDHCSGARVNGQQVALSYRLKNGDTVEITTSEKQVPSKDWLSFVESTKAKQHIRSWVKQDERRKSISVGKELLSKDLPKVKLKFSKLIKEGLLENVAKDLGLTSADMLLADIGYGKISTKQVVSRLLPEDPDVDEKLAKDETALQKIFQKAAKTFRDRGGVRVNGLDDVVFRFARCCEPLPGDPVVGYVTRGRGVTIHTRWCTQMMGFDPQRLIDVSWDDSSKTPRRVRLTVLTVDQVGILALMTQSISHSGANIVGAQISATPYGKAVSTFEITVESTAQLEAITKSLEKIEGVLRVERKKRRSPSAQSSSEKDSA